MTSLNILVKAVSFYLESFRRYGVLINVHFFLAHLYIANNYIREHLSAQYVFLSGKVSMISLILLQFTPHIHQMLLSCSVYTLRGSRPGVQSTSLIYDVITWKLQQIEKNADHLPHEIL